MSIQLNDSVFELHTPQAAPEFEFVFFHGLYGESFKLKESRDLYLATWESGDGSCIWPQTWLVDEFPKAQILFVSYRGKIEKWSGGSHDMHIVGENLASDMMQAKIGQTPHCPVILVGHCLGGLVLKQVCLQVSNQRSRMRADGEGAKLEMFLDNVKRIFYYGTPHYGHPLIDKISNVSRDPLLSYIKILSTEGSRLNSEFEQLCRKDDWQYHSLGESLPAKSVSGPNSFDHRVY
jgi:hypothetical protein